MTTPPDNPRTVPLTEIRGLYESLIRAKAADCDKVAAEFLAEPGRLAHLLSQSVQELESYDNSTEPFHNRGPGGGLSESRAASQQPADRWLQRIHQDPRVSDGLGDLEFRYVDYEVPPIRTPGSIYETGELASKSGRGGIDVLLRNAHDSIPAVGEIKAETDSTKPLVMLLQTLTYAIEISTANQLRRIRQHYQCFANVTNNSLVDVNLFLFHGYVLKYAEKPQNQLGTAFAIAARLAMEPTCPRFLRRFVAFTVSADNDLSVTFRCDNIRT